MAARSSPGASKREEHRGPGHEHDDARERLRAPGAAQEAEEGVAVLVERAPELEQRADVVVEAGEREHEEQRRRREDRATSARAPCRSRRARRRAARGRTSRRPRDRARGRERAAGRDSARRARRAGRGTASGARRGSRRSPAARARRRRRRASRARRRSSSDSSAAREPDQRDRPVAVAGEKIVSGADQERGQRRPDEVLAAIERIVRRRGTDCCQRAGAPSPPGRARCGSRARASPSVRDDEHRDGGHDRERRPGARSRGADGCRGHHRARSASRPGSREGDTARSAGAAPRSQAIRSRRRARARRRLPRCAVEGAVAEPHAEGKQPHDVESWAGERERHEEQDEEVAPDDRRERRARLRSPARGSGAARRARGSPSPRRQSTARAAVSGTPRSVSSANRVYASCSNVSPRFRRSRT